MAVQVKESLADAVRGAIIDTSNTADVGRLQSKFAYLPVFVYGTTQKNYSDDNVMRKFPRVGIGYTYGNHYIMYKSKEHEAVAFCDPLHKEAAHLYGELYVVPPSVIFHLDAMLCVGTHFQRRWDVIVYKQPNLKPGEKPIWYSSDAIIYEGIRGEWNRFLSARDTKPLARFHADYGPFYRFTLTDDRPNREVVDNFHRNIF